MSAPRISGVLETCLYVDDLERARAFYDRVFALPVMFGDDRLVVYDAGPASALLLFQRGSTLNTVHLPGGAIPPHDGHGPLHFALAIPTERARRLARASRQRERADRDRKWYGRAAA